MKLRLPSVEASDVKDSNNINNISNNVNAMNNYSKVENKLEIETRINHQGEVNKARAMPQKYNIIATKTPSGEVHVFDYFKHPPKPSDNLTRPDIRLLGHSKEGYGLNWNPNKEGYLLSGSDDQRVCLWDINKNSSSLDPIKIIDNHKGAVEDVSWHKHQETIFATCGDDKKLMLWDLKQDNPINVVEAHSQEVNSVEFNYFNDFQIITASSDKTIVLWDIRNLSIKLHIFEHHRSDVTAARWNPNFESVFASFSSDRRVNVWDTSRIGRQQSAVDAEDGPVELLVNKYINIVYSWWTYCQNF
jgi:histone-binding protein RBBP4